MPLQSEVDAGARLLSKLCHDGCELEGHIEPCVSPPCRCRAAVKEILIAAEVERIAEARRTCRHPRRNGSGSLSSDGSSKMSWYCPDCGQSDSYETPARAASEILTIG